jgi:hypothetical protein
MATLIRSFVSDDKAGSKDLATKVYTDLASPAASAVGDAVGRAMKVALLPVHGVLWTLEKAAEEVRVRAAAVLTRRQVTETQVSVPSRAVLGGVIVGVQAAAGEEDLVQLYAHLLASAMDTTTATLAHPAFAEIIRQMTGDEARLFGHIARNAPVSLGPPSRGPLELRKARIGEAAGCAYPERANAYVSNLKRLGLIEDDADLAGAFSSHVESPSVDFTYPPVALVLTAFGNEFRKVCVPDL